VKLGVGLNTAPSEKSVVSVAVPRFSSETLALRVPPGESVPVETVKAVAATSAIPSEPGSKAR